MLSIGPGMRIFLAAGVTDLRKSFDTLAAVVSEVIGDDPLSGHLFLFCNRRRDRLKVLHWTDSGFWLCAKRLEVGTFNWPDRGTVKVEYSRAELAALLEGADILVHRRRRWFNKKKPTQNHR
jgi:transposase